MLSVVSMVIKMNRNILHVDINNCYASIECLYHPELKNKPIAVAGASEERHGIILAKNEAAKKYGIKTGEVIWQAKQKCPELITFRPHYDRYLAFSKKARLIYERYTDRIQPFGIDECWLDVTCTRRNIKDVAEEIRETVKKELGLTVSVGASFNKVFAKLGSDMKKPDAVTLITRENFREKIWKLPASDLLYVGRSTNKKLKDHGIFTIGDLANTPLSTLEAFLGKIGTCLYRYSNGLGDDFIPLSGDESPVKSVSNGTTAAHDLTGDSDVKALLSALSESVAARLRKTGLKTCEVAISVRDSKFRTYSRQCPLAFPSDDGRTISSAAFSLFQKSYDWDCGINVRSLSVCAGKLCTGVQPIQLDMFTDIKAIEKHESLNKAIDKIRARYGYSSINRAIIFSGGFNGFDSRIQNELLPAGSF